MILQLECEIKFRNVELNFVEYRIYDVSYWLQIFFFFLIYKRYIRLWIIFVINRTGNSIFLYWKYSMNFFNRKFTVENIFKIFGI